MINALRYTENLEEAGFTTEQAKSSVKIWMELMDDNFATKYDLEKQGFLIKEDFVAIRSEMKEEFTAVRSEMKEEFAAVRSEMKDEFVAVRSEMKEGFAAVNSEIQTIKSDINSITDKIVIRMTKVMVVLMGLTIGVMTGIQNFLMAS